MTPGGEISLDPLLQACEPDLLEAGDLRLREAVVCELGERRPLPERKRLVQVSLALQALEPSEIELVGLDAELIAGCLRLHPVLAQGLPELRHVDLKRLRRGVRRRLVPQRVDQAVARDDAVCLQQEESEESALLLSTEIDRVPVRAHLQRAEDLKLQRQVSPDANSGCASLKEVCPHSALPRALTGPKVRPMDGLMMDYQLTLPTILRRAETYFASKTIVTRQPDRSFHRYTYGDSCRRARQLAVALQKLGLDRGDRVATFGWNHYRHHECYLGIPCGGFVLHTLNIRLHPGDLAYIASHAGDRVVIADASLVPLLEQFRGETEIEHVFVFEYELRGPARDRRAGRVARPRAGRERGGGDVLHERHDGPSEGRRLLAPLDRPAHPRRRIRRAARASRSPRRTRSSRSCRCSTRTPGATRTWRDARRQPRLPGPAPRRREPARGLRGASASPGRPACRRSGSGSSPSSSGAGPVRPLGPQGDALRRLGAPAGDDRRLPPPRPVRRPRLGDDRDLAGRVDVRPPGRPQGRRPGEQLDYISLQGLPLPFVEVRARGEDGNDVPWDDKTMGELEIRGPWVAASYYDTPEQADRWTDDGWFKTGDIVAIDPRASSTSRTARRT